MLDIWNDVGGNDSLPSSQRVAASSASAGRGEMDGIAHLVRIGDVTLHAAHAQVPGHGPAPADAHDIAEPVARGRFARDAPVDALAAAAEFADHAAHAVAIRRTLLVARQQQRDGARMARMRGHESLERERHRRDAGLHVGCAAAVQASVADRRLERRARPLRDRAAGYDIGVAEEDENGGTRSMRRPEIVDFSVAQVLDGESRALQALGEQLLAAGVVGRDRSAADQFASEIEDGGHWCGGERLEWWTTNQMMDDES